MTQDLTYLHANKLANKNSVDLIKSGPSEDESHSNNTVKCNIGTLQEQLKSAQDSIRFLQSEHALMLKDLHEEVEHLQETCRDIQFHRDVGQYMLPDTEFFQCSPHSLEEKVDKLLEENADLRRKLTESYQAIDILDQKEKLALWQHHQELEQRDLAIQRLEKELESQSSTITQLSTQSSTSSSSSRRKKGNFWRRFSFISSNHPSTSSGSSTSSTQRKLQQPRVEHLSKEDLPYEMQSSLQSFESQYQSYSSYSSLSDKSISDDEGFAQRCEKDPNALKLPPIPLASSTKQLVRQQQLRISHKDSLAIEPIPKPELSVKRLNKA